MIYLFLLGGLFLGWSFGRNNLSNVFGTAIGTRMVPFFTAASLAGIFIFLGGVFSSAETTGSFLHLAEIKTGLGAFLVSFSIALTILIAGKFGIPVSIAQSSVGALIGWNLFFRMSNDWPLIFEMVAAWFYGPCVAAVFAMGLFYAFRMFLRCVRVPLLYRDLWVQGLLIVSGAYASYFLGANNLPAISGIYLEVVDLNRTVVVVGICLAIALGVLMADKRVIETVSKGLFPLSPLEALVVVFSCGLTLYCFSGVQLARLLQYLHLPSFPLVPVPSSSVLIGAIIGVGAVKGHAGFRWSKLIKVIVSWLAVPCISALICCVILGMLQTGGFSF